MLVSNLKVTNSLKVDLTEFSKFTNGSVVQMTIIARFVGILNSPKTEQRRILLLRPTLQINFVQASEFCLDMVKQ